MKLPPDSDVDQKLVWKNSEKQEKQPSSSDSDFEAPSTDSESSQEFISKPRKKGKGGDKKPDIDKSVLEILIDKLDNRKTPIYRKFNEGSGESLKDYLETFEDYCENNLKGGSRFWVDELEEKLSGETLKAFRSVKTNKDGYEDIKRKLLSWFSEMKQARKRRAKMEFNKIQYNSKEPLYLYSNRLEKAFSKAYPNAKAEKNSTLREKYMNTIPKSARNQLSFISFIGNKPITWSHIQELAARRDSQMGEYKCSSSSEEDTDVKEIFINVNRDKPKKKEKKVEVKYDQKKKSFFINGDMNNENPPNVQFSASNFKDKNKRFSNYTRKHEFEKFDQNDNFNQKRPASRNYEGNVYQWRNQNDANRNEMKGRFSVPHSKTNIKSCYRCGRPGHMASHCFATTCADCNQSGHSPKECWAKNPRNFKPKTSENRYQTFKPNYFSAGYNVPKNKMNSQRNDNEESN